MDTETSLDSSRFHAVVTELFGALLSDRGVLEIRVTHFAAVANEQCRVVVVRAQRREILALDTPELTLSDEEYSALFTQGGRPLGDWFARGSTAKGERQLLLSRRALDAKISLDVFHEEGALPPAVVKDALRAAASGNGVCVIGPNAAYNQRVVAAFANALEEQFCVQRFAQDHSLSELAVTTEIAAVARLSGQEFVEAATLRPQVIWVVSILCPNISAARRVPKLLEHAPHLLYFAAPERIPRLIERHAPSRELDAAPRLPSESATPTTRPPEVAAPSPIATFQPSPSDDLPPIPELGEAPPSDWAIDDAKHDIPHIVGALRVDAPGMLSDENSGFSDVLNSVRERPTFTPSKPLEHPQAQALKDKAGGEQENSGEALEPDPFGGLTFEAPPRKEES